MHLYSIPRIRPPVLGSIRSRLGTTPSLDNRRSCPGWPRTPLRSSAVLPTTDPRSSPRSSPCMHFRRALPGSCHRTHSLPAIPDTSPWQTGARLGIGLQRSSRLPDIPATLTCQLHPHAEAGVALLALPCVHACELICPSRHSPSSLQQVTAAGWPNTGAPRFQNREASSHVSSASSSEGTSSHPTLSSIHPTSRALHVTYGNRHIYCSKAPDQHISLTIEICRRVVILHRLAGVGRPHAALARAARRGVSAVGITNGVPSVVEASVAGEGVGVLDALLAYGAGLCVQCRHSASRA